MLINDQMVSLLSRRENHSAKRKEMLEQLQNTPQLIYMSLNKNSVYCVMPRSSKPPDTCKWGGPKLRGILKFSRNVFFFQYRDKNKSFRLSAKGNHLSTTAVSYFSRQKVVTLTGFCVPDIHIPNCSELKVCIYVASFQRSQKQFFMENILHRQRKRPEKRENC